MSSSKKSSRKQAHGEERSSSRSRSVQGAGRRDGAGSRGKAARSRRGGLALPFSGSRLLLLGLAVLVIGAGAYLLLNRERPRPWADGDGPKKPWNVLLVSLDTTRPDRLEACGGGPVPTPGLDRVLGDGFLFTEMITPVPNTLPAHASLFTGDNPYRHGVRENIEHALAVPTPTLAAAYRDAGYTTAAVVAAFVMSERFGLAQGFEFYEDRLWGPEPGLGPGTVELPGEIIVSRTTRYLADYHARRQRGEEDRPFFLFVHFFDAHTPYQPPMPHAAQYPDQPYHGELAYQDLCLARVLDALETYGLAENTLIWVVSDHGESLWEHGEPTHAVFIYDCAVKVVSVLRPPAENGRYEATAPRLRIRAQTSLIDVAPTLLELTRTPAWSLPASSLPAEGASLVPLMRAEEVAERPAYCETLSPMISYHWAPLYGVRTADWKYIRAPTEELYDLRADPGELENLAGHRPQEARRLEQQLDEFLAGTGEDLARAHRIPTAEERARLESLGYVATSGPATDLDSADLPDPKTMAPYFFAHQDRAMGLLRRQEFDEAIRILEESITRDPRNNSVWLFLGNAYRGAGRLEEAGAAYRASLAIQEHSPRAYSGWGQALFEAGEFDSAEWALGRAIEQLPSSPDSWIRRAAVHASRGRWRAAAADYDSALARGGYPLLLHGFLARIYQEKLSEPGRAEHHLREFARLGRLPVDQAADRLPSLEALEQAGAGAGQND